MKLNLSGLGFKSLKAGERLHSKQEEGINIGIRKSENEKENVLNDESQPADAKNKTNNDGKFNTQEVKDQDIEEPEVDENIQEESGVSTKRDQDKIENLKKSEMKN